MLTEKIVGGYTWERDRLLSLVATTAAANTITARDTQMNTTDKELTRINNQIFNLPNRMNCYTTFVLLEAQNDKMGDGRHNVDISLGSASSSLIVKSFSDSDDDDSENDDDDDLTHHMMMILPTMTTMRTVLTTGYNTQ